jgi:hypothetical protein
MDNKQLMHMACEGIVIGGVSLYFAKQLKQANKEIEELKSIIAKNQAANEKRFEVLFNYIDNMSQQSRQIQPQKIVQKQVKIVPKQVKKVVKKLPEEDEVISVQKEEEEDEVDLEEETKALLEEDIDEDIDA